MTEYIISTTNMPEHVMDAAVAAWIKKEIVRCRDCIHYSGEDDEIYPKWCMQMNITEVEPNGFCAWGERK